MALPQPSVGYNDYALRLWDVIMSITDQIATRATTIRYEIDGRLHETSNPEEAMRTVHALRKMIHEEVASDTRLRVGRVHNTVYLNCRR